jgi:pimeloyl-ACP methyl ester carboxylesterase
VGQPVNPSVRGRPQYRGRVTRVKRGYDWGERSPRWAGVRSEVVDVGGVRVHYLRTDAAAAAPPDATPHLLIHPMGAGSWWWMEVIRPLSVHGRVIVPDLPGAGRTKPSERRAGSARTGARFLVDFAQALGLDRVVVHGHSMGALAGVLFADLAPERLARLVLAAPALPGRPDPPRLPGLWRLALAAAPTLAHIPMQALIRRKAGMWRRWREDPRDPQLANAMRSVGTDASRISPELLGLIAEEIERYRLPWRIDGAINAGISAISAMTVDQEPVRQALARISAPTLLLWGTADRVIPHALIDDLVAEHPDWAFEPVGGIGHLLPWEAPETYVGVVGPWSTESA